MHPPTALPEFKARTVRLSLEKLPCVFHGCLIVRTLEFGLADDLVLGGQEVAAILFHDPHGPQTCRPTLEEYYCNFVTCP